MRKTELIVSGEVICPKTKASIVAHEHTNVEALLDQQNRTSSTITQSSAMSQVGLGDGEDLSFCVEDGFYESATLSGKTMVNCIQEPSSKDVVLPYAFENGQYVTIKDTKESGALGVELKGQTLVNLLNFNKIIANAITHSKDGGKITVSTISERAWASLDIFIESLKPNTDYILMVDNVSFTHADNFGATVAVYCRDGNVKLGQLPSQSSNFFKFNTADKDLSLITLRIHATLGSANSATTVVNGLRVLEYQQGMENWDIPYFEGMTSCRMPILHTVGKNLIDYKNYNLKANAGQNPQEIIIGENQLSFNVNKASWVSLWYDLYLESGENYKLSYDTNLLKCFIFKSKVNTYVNSELVTSATVINATEDKIQKVEKTFTAPSTGFIRIRLTSEQKIGNHILQNFQIEKGATATTYEPHKSSILSLPEEVVLCKVGNVEDTFNCNTGEYVQRIKEVVFNGNESWVYSGDHVSNEEYAVYHAKIVDLINSSNLGVANNLPYDKEAISTTMFTKECVYINSAYQVCYIRIKRERSGIVDYLTSNPLTVQYELATPIVTKVNLSSALKSWNTTTHIYSEIPENTLYPTLSHSNPSYPVILKPSTKYSIVANSYSNDHANSAINFNLGGATATTTVGNRVTTITTPSTLSNELLTMSGRENKLNNVMVIEGDVVGDEPYFEGMCDSKSPILSNVGKNLINALNCSVRMGATILSKEQNCITFKAPNVWGGLTYHLYLKPNTTYTFSFERDSVDTRGYVRHKTGMSDWSGGHGGGNKYTFTTDGLGVVMFTIESATVRDSVTVKNIMIEEGSVATPYEPYKSNILSCNGDKIELTRDMLEQGGYDGNTSLTYEETKSDNTKRLRTKTYVKVMPSTTYRISSSSFKFNHREYLSNGFTNGVRSEWTNELLFATHSTTHYITLLLKDTDNDNKTLSVDLYNNDDVVIREVDKTIVLRSLPNGVCDTLNVETGEYVQRIGEATFDGSSDETWKMQSDVGGGKTRFIVTNKTDDRKVYSSQRTTGYLLCDKFREISFYDLYIEGKNGVAGWESGKTISFINGMTVLSDFISLISQSPIILQYELETPIVKAVDLSGYPFSYESGHVQLSSGHNGQSLTPKVEYVVQTNRAGAIQANQDRLLNHDKRLAMLEDLVLHQLIQLEYNRAKCTFLSQTRQIFERGIQMYHTKYELLSEFIEKKLYRSLEEVFEMLDVYFMLGDITDGEYDALYEALMPSAEEIFEVEETFDHEDVEV